MSLDTCICIPTKRPPPIRTLLSYVPSLEHEIFVLADPEVYEAHQHFVTNLPVAPTVLVGGVGVGEQIYAMYRQSYLHHFKCFFRLDDDLDSKTFVHKDGHYPDLNEVITAARSCLDECKVSHAGFMNGANRFWMKEGFHRTYGLIHGGANIAYSAENPSPFIDIRLKRSGDVYRSCAHREKDGAVGRVSFIGFNKKESTLHQSMIPLDPVSVAEARDIILARFPTMVKYSDTRIVNGYPIPDWKMKRS